MVKSLNSKDKEKIPTKIDTKTRNRLLTKKQEFVTYFLICNTKCLWTVQYSFQNFGWKELQPWYSLTRYPFSYMKGKSTF